jgi:hypothetical protein
MRIGITCLSFGNGIATSNFRFPLNPDIPIDVTERLPKAG